MPEQVTVTIPDGEYCKDCVFLEYFDYALVDIMGNETGNRRSGYRCKRYGYELDGCDRGCWAAVKKCSSCKMTPEERWQEFATMFAVFMLLDKEQKSKSPMSEEELRQGIEENGKRWKKVAKKNRAEYTEGLQEEVERLNRELKLHNDGEKLRCIFESKSK